jgi:hypothetical protein
VVAAAAQSAAKFTKQYPGTQSAFAFLELPHPQVKKQQLTSTIQRQRPH